MRKSLENHEENKRKILDYESQIMRKSVENHEKNQRKF